MRVNIFDHPEGFEVVGFTDGGGQARRIVRFADCVAQGSLAPATGAEREIRQELGLFTPSGPDDPDLTWTCHVCGDERPDAVIKVHSRVVASAFDGSIEHRVNARYCADRRDCSLGVAAVAGRWATGTSGPGWPE